MPHAADAICARMPGGVAFPLSELVGVRDWAARLGLGLSIRLDQVLDGVEFEEVALISAPAQGPRTVGPRTVVLWRTCDAVVVQAAGGQPLVFSAMPAALAYVAARFRRQAGAGRVKRWVAGLLCGGSRVPALPEPRSRTMRRA